MKTITQRGQQQYGMARPDGFYVEDPVMPKNMMVELTNACNHACVFCANPHMTRKPRRIDRALLERLLAEARAQGVEELGFYTTGDPFVHRDLADFTRRAKDLGYRYVYISTNGALATPERARKVIDAGMDSIKFSINAGSRESYRLVHGADEFDLVLANLRFISEYRKTLDRPLALFVTCVVTNPIRHELEGFRRLVEPMVDEVSFNECGIQSGQMTAAQALLSAGATPPRSENGVCPLPFNRLHVTCEGYLTLCCVDYQNYLTVGDLASASLAEVWHSPVAREARRRHIQGTLEGTLCGNCWLGRMDAIEPLVPAHATVVDFRQFYEATAKRTTIRLKTKA
jgi:pyruvate-formate lyase-activating enzyme